MRYRRPRPNPERSSSCSTSTACSVARGPTRCPRRPTPPPDPAPTFPPDPANFSSAPELFPCGPEPSRPMQERWGARADPVRVRPDADSPLDSAATTGEGGAPPGSHTSGHRPPGCPGRDRPDPEEPRMSATVTTPGPAQDVRPVRRALVSVYDKTGLEDLARGLHEAGVALVSTGVGRAHRVARHPRDQGRGPHRLPRVPRGPRQDAAPARARRHPRRHPQARPRRAARRPRRRAVRARRRQPLPVRAQTVASGAGPDECVEQIDIGGPSMVRAAAKNHPSVAVVVDPGRLRRRAGGRRGRRVHARRSASALAAQAFVHTATYDVAVASWWATPHRQLTDGTGFPAWVGATWERAAVLRYGENPHQHAALYTNGPAAAGPRPGDPAARQGDVVQQLRRRGRRRARGARPRRPADGGRSSSTPTRAASPSAPTSPTRTARPTRATPSPPSAASSRPTAR